MHKFKVIVRNADGSQEWELPFSSFSVSEELNNDRSGNFRFEKAVIDEISAIYNISVENIFSAGYREIYVQDTDGNTIYGGYVSELLFSRGQGDSPNLTVNSKGFFSLLEKRYTGFYEFIENEDASDIAWGLIYDTQNQTYGDLGITRGANPTTKSRQRTFRFDNIADEIKSLCATEVKEGFDFEVDNNKVFNVYFPEKGTVRPDIVLESGFNINTYNITKTFINSMANQVIVTGEGQGEDLLYSIRDAENVYKENFFLLQDLLTETNIQQVSTLDDKGDRYLDENKYPRYIISLTTDYENPNYNNFVIGDRLRIIIPEFQINNFYRVYKRNVQQDRTVNLSFRAI